MKDKVESPENSHKMAMLSNVAEVHVLHSQMMNLDDRAVFAKCPRGRRKIILATNIAEASITFDDVVIVVDSGLAKEVHMVLFVLLHVTSVLYYIENKLKRRSL